MISNFWKTMRSSIVVFLFFYGCVGPPEPDHGLIENKPVVVNDVSAFSFLMRNDRHTFEEEYNFNFSNFNPNNTLTSSLIISEYAGKDTLFINLYDENYQSVYNYAINGNYSKIDNYSLKIPNKIIFRGNNFSGTIDYSLIVQ